MVEVKKIIIPEKDAKPPERDAKLREKDAKPSENGARLTESGVRPAVRKVLSVGEVAARSGLAVSAIHFYEAQGLIRSSRTAGNQRRYPREILRRVSVIKVAQRIGIPLSIIREALLTLPRGRTPTEADWKKLSSAWKATLDERIDKLLRLRGSLNECIGCGCLSLKVCPLRNPSDILGDEGCGPRLLDPAAGDPAAGDPAAGDPAAGVPAAGVPAASDPLASRSAAGVSATGDLAAHYLAIGDLAAGDPAAGDPDGGVLSARAGATQRQRAQKLRRAVP